MRRKWRNEAAAFSEMAIYFIGQAHASILMAFPFLSLFGHIFLSQIKAREEMGKKAMRKERALFGHIILLELKYFTTELQ